MGVNGLCLQGNLAHKETHPPRTLPCLRSLGGHRGGGVFFWVRNPCIPLTLEGNMVTVRERNANRAAWERVIERKTDVEREGETGDRYS